MDREGGGEDEGKEGEELIGKERNYNNLFLTVISKCSEIPHNLKASYVTCCNKNIIKEKKKTPSLDIMFHFYQLNSDLIIKKSLIALESSRATTLKGDSKRIIAENSRHALTSD